MGRLRGMLRPGPGNQTQMQPATQPNQPQQFGQPPSQNTSMGGLFSSLTGSSQAQPTNQQPYGQANQQNQRIQHKGVPQVIPNVGGMAPSGVQPQQGLPGGPNLMQKLNEITAPGGDILSKGKELIFMKFGLGGK